MIQNCDAIVPIRCHGNKQIKEGKIGFFSGLKSAVIKILNDES